MAVEIIYRVVKRSGEHAGEFMDKKWADAYDQRLDCVYTLVDLIEEVDPKMSDEMKEAIADKLIANRADITTAFKKVKDIPADVLSN